MTDRITSDPAAPDSARTEDLTDVPDPLTPAPGSGEKALTIRGATVLGIGSMVGAGIFALLGEAGAVAGPAVWVSFLIGGVIAGLLGYVCAKLGMRFPSSGGLITYMIEGFGKGRLVGTACWLGYLAAIVIVGAMVAVSFGGYATSLFVGQHASSGWNNLFITVLIIGMVAINLVGAKFVANAQSIIVVCVLGAFAVFIVVTIANMNTHLLAFSGYPSLKKIVASVALTFFAYLGFNVITFTAGDLRRPKHDLPRAMTYALGITALVYVLIAVGVFGTLTTAQVIAYGPTAMAEAARPSLGDAGFTMMAIVALLSTAGCTNATLYASGNLTDQLAKAGLFPEFFGERSPLGRHAGLLVTSALVLVIANIFDLSAIASVGSAVSLMAFLLVAAAGWRLRATTGSNPALIVLALAMTAIVLGFFVVDTFQTAPGTFVAIVLLVLLAAVFDSVIRRHHHAAARATPSPT
jgi:amino acid transporter